MPTIATPPSAGLHDRAADDHRRGAGRTLARSVLLRTRVVTHRDELTRELAEGADPTSSPVLALRAAQLTSERCRRQLRRTLRQTVAEAHRPSMTRFAVTIIRRRAVLDAEDALETTIERLASPEPVAPEGMALIERLLTNADASPLYNVSAPSALRRVVLVATAALEPGTEELW